MKWLSYFFKSSIGRKQLMALTGISLSGFLIVHLSGNLLLFTGHEQFNAYAAFLESQPWLIPAEIGLVAIFLVHMYLAISLTLENKRARGGSYGVKRPSEASMASRTMIYSGMLLFIFIVIHLVSFKYGQRPDDTGLAGLVVDKFSDPLYVAFYVVCMVVLAFHLMHGIQSALQSFGVNHPSYNDLVKKLCFLTSVGLSLGFAAIPIWLFLNGGA